MCRSTGEQSSERVIYKNYKDRHGNAIKDYSLISRMITTPPYLQPGDTIGIICPSGAMPVERVSECIRVFNEEWGFKTKVGKTVGNQFHYFSDPDAGRLADLQQMLDDDEVKAILCARGGYGMTRIIDSIDFKKFEKNPKWIIGYSDITVLHSHLYNNYYIS